jgi:hypothetical protein
MGYVARSALIVMLPLSLVGCGISQPEFDECLAKLMAAEKQIAKMAETQDVIIHGQQEKWAQYEADRDVLIRGANANVSSLHTAIGDERVARAERVFSLELALDAENKIRSREIRVLQIALDGEIDSRNEEGDTLSLAVANEKASRIEEDSALQLALADEKISRVQADDGIRKAITKEHDLMTRVLSQFSDTISEQSTAVVQVTRALRDSITWNLDTVLLMLDTYRSLEELKTDGNITAEEMQAELNEAEKRIMLDQIEALKKQIAALE